MTTHRTRQSIAAFAIAFWAIFGAKAVAATDTHPPHRTCPEDAVWMGTGQYAGGYWSHYRCVSWDSIKLVWRRTH